MQPGKSGKLSAVIITRNEEHNIGRCIQSLYRITADIVVIDSGSTDRTIAIAAGLGARVFRRQWTGYSDQKNFGNDLALYHYILSIDADECVSRQLADSINKEMAAPAHSVYEMDFLTSWEGRFVYYGSWYPDRHCRLFDKRRIKWDGKSVHEQLLMNGYVPGRLEGHMHHHTARDRDWYRIKMTRYAAMFAGGRKQQQRFSPYWKKYLSSSFRFVKDYVVKRGFLEGRAGFDIALEEARYTFLKYKWSERKRQARWRLRGPGV